ncbi:hypothetical protein [Variovorax saccharolyticus]|uniref:hypothetical protein n=1 Tax=Variovorax saccharolyticus TaxID=3053516 RepID=UPI002577E131|nr:hypothetical protein [Variovorax sp. J22R187]MDM0021485.1 hypothetical protein [Variovorax sp. J22R187]
MEKTRSTELATADGTPVIDEEDAPACTGRSRTLTRTACEEEAERIDALWVAACRHQAQLHEEVLARERHANQA